MQLIILIVGSPPAISNSLVEEKQNRQNTLT